MKKHVNKKRVTTKKEDKDFETSAKCWIYDNVYAYSKSKRC